MKPFAITLTAVALVALATPGAAYAQLLDDADPHMNQIVRAGPQPSRGGVLAPGVAIVYAASLDVDGDGRTDDLLTVREPPSEPGEPSPRAFAWVVARHTAAGWIGEVLQIDDEARSSSSWGEPLVVGARTFLVLGTYQHDPDAAREHDPGADAMSGYAFVSFDVAGNALVARPPSNYPRGTRGGFSTFTATTDGLVVEETSSGMSRTLRWSGTQFAGSPWTRRRPAPTYTHPTVAYTPSPSCTTRLAASFHLRPTEALASIGPEVAARTEVVLLGPGSFRRRGVQVFRVRVTATGMEGYTFVPSPPSGCGAF